jgi:D-alanyl-D-alanine dipeptidase
MIAGTITLISDPKVLRIPIQENHDPIVDVRDYPAILLDTRKSDVSNSYFRLRRSVVAKLVEATRHLPRDIRFLVVEGHRPLSLQKRYFDGYTQQLRGRHADWDNKRIYDEASKYVAPPEIIPPHSTGGAVDLTLATKEGNEMDMGTRLNVNPEESDNACFTFAANISASAKGNRQLLINAMSKGGFVNYPTEWWHWSYGDKYWAYHTSSPFACFGSVE